MEEKFYAELNQDLHDGSILDSFIESLELPLTGKYYISESKLLDRNLGMNFQTIKKVAKTSDLIEPKNLNTGIYDYLKNRDISKSKKSDELIINKDSNVDKKFYLYNYSDNMNILSKTFSLNDIKNTLNESGVKTKKDDFIEIDSKSYLDAIEDEFETTELSKAIIDKQELEKYVDELILDPEYIQDNNINLYKENGDVLNYTNKFSNRDMKIYKKCLRDLITNSSTDVSYIKERLNKFTDSVSTYKEAYALEQNRIVDSKLLSAIPKNAYVDDLARYLNTEYKLKLEDKIKTLKENYNESQKSEKILVPVSEAMDNKSLIKQYSDCYLYNSVKKQVEPNLMKFIQTSIEVNKSTESFQRTVVEAMKYRRTDNSIIKVLMSDNVVLLMSNNNLPLPRSFKVFVSKDIRTGHDINKRKAFIDVTSVITYKDGEYTIRERELDILITYITSAMHQFIYYGDPKMILMDRDILVSGAKCFAMLYKDIVNYLLKISVNGNLSGKVLYLAAIYYFVNLLKKDMTESYYNIAKKIAKLDSEEEYEITMMQFGGLQNMTDIKIFTTKIAEICGNTSMTLNVFVDKWTYRFGPGTQYAMELYPAFANMLINASSGQYLNNSASISNICGTDMVVFYKAGLRIGNEVTRNVK